VPECISYVTPALLETLGTIEQEPRISLELCDGESNRIVSRIKLKNLITSPASFILL